MKRIAGLWVLAALVAGLTAPQADAQSGYKIRSGDTLRVEVLEDSALNRDVLVLPDGSINFPLVGPVAAQGVTVTEVQNALAAGLASNFASPPTVFVSVQNLAERRSLGTGTVSARTINAYIMGEVANPGKFEVTVGTTLLQFLAEAGGLTEFAAGRRIQLHRTDRQTGETSIYLFSYSGRTGGQRIPAHTVLADGDVVVVPERRLFE